MSRIKTLLSPAFIPAILLAIASLIGLFVAKADTLEITSLMSMEPLTVPVSIMFTLGAFVIASCIPLAIHYIGMPEATKMATHREPVFATGSRTSHRYGPFDCTAKGLDTSTDRRYRTGKHQSVTSEKAIPVFMQTLTLPGMFAGVIAAIVAMLWMPGILLAIPLCLLISMALALIDISHLPFPSETGKFKEQFGVLSKFEDNPFGFAPQTPSRTFKAIMHRIPSNWVRGVIMILSCTFGFTLVASIKFGLVTALAMAVLNFVSLMIVWTVVGIPACVAVLVGLYLVINLFAIMSYCSSRCTQVTAKLRTTS